MRSNFPLWLPVFSHTEDTLALRQAGIETELKQGQIIRMPFYEISNIEPALGDPEMCLVISGNRGYWIDLNIAVVVDLIERHVVDPSEKI